MPKYKKSTKLMKRSIQDQEGQKAGVQLLGLPPKHILCPGCNTRIPFKTLGVHLDFSCTSTPSISSKTTGKRSREKEEPTTAAAAAAAPKKRASSVKEAPLSQESQVDAFAALKEAQKGFKEEMWLVWDAKRRGFIWGWGLRGKAGLLPEGVKKVWTATVASGRTSVCELCTNLGPGTSACQSGSLLKPGAKLSRLSVSQLQSILQKNVRRGRAEAAVRCWLELLSKSLNKAVRRIIIIMMEDAMLHPALPLLCWLLVAVGKGYQPPAQLLVAATCIVHEIAACPKRDTPPCEAPPTPPDVRSLVKAELPAQEAAICRGLLMRQAYGGMACDVSMLGIMCHLWQQRFLRETAPAAQTGASHRRPFQYMHSDVKSAARKSTWLSFLMDCYKDCGMPDELLSGLVLAALEDGFSDSESGLIVRPEDAHPAGIDYHVSDILSASVLQNRALRESVEAQLGDVGEEKLVGFLEKLMWKFRSGVNERTDLGLSHSKSSSSSSSSSVELEIWEKISPAVEAWAEERLRGVFLRQPEVLKPAAIGVPWHASSC
ncbi:unnamed protein product [Chrysoparadoxa australica]